MKLIIKNIVLTSCLLTLLLISCSSEDDATTTPLATTDKIESTLTTSKAAYQNANASDWINITKEEFDNLSNNLSEVSKIGLEERLYPNSTDDLTSISNSSGTTYANETTATIPRNSYVFAIRFFVGTGIFAQSKDNIIKISDTSITEEYSNLGNLLPDSNSGSKEEVFYVLKENDIMTENIGYLAINMRGPNGLLIIKDASYKAYRGLDDTDTLPFTSEGFHIIFQGLSTTQKQWD